MSIRTSLAWAYSGQIASFFVAFFGSIVVARLLTPHELGIFAIAMAAQGIVQVFVAFGVGAYIIKEPSIDEDMIDTAFTINMILAIALSLILFSISFAGASILGDTSAGNVLRVSAIGPLISIFSFKPSVILQREMKFKFISMIGLSTGIASTVVTILSALSGASYMSPVFGNIASGLFALVLYYRNDKVQFRQRISIVNWRGMTIFGLRMISVGGVATLAGRSSEMILGRLLGVTALGLYTRASGLSNMIWSNVYGTATQVVFVQMAEDFRQTGELRATFLKSLSIITSIMWPILIGLAVLARPVIHILYGDKWLAAAAPLSLLMIMQFFALCYGMNWELFVLKNETGTQTKLEITRSLIGLGVFTVGCFFSLEGAAFGRTLDSFIGIIFYYGHVRRLAKTEEGELPRLYGQSAVLTFAAVAPVGVLMLANRWSERTPIFEIAACVSAGGFAWLGIMSYLDHPIMVELRMLRLKLSKPEAKT